MGAAIREQVSSEAPDIWAAAVDPEEPEPEPRNTGNGVWVRAGRKRSGPSRTCWDPGASAFKRRLN